MHGEERLQTLEYDVAFDGEYYRARYTGFLTEDALRDGCVRELEDTDLTELRRRAVINRISAWKFQCLARCGDLELSTPAGNTL
jgi:hypothetical protein